MLFYNYLLDHPPRGERKREMYILGKYILCYTRIHNNYILSCKKKLDFLLQ